jgi:hypothetical protein
VGALPVCLFVGRGDWKYTPEGGVRGGKGEHGGRRRDRGAGDRDSMNRKSERARHHVYEDKGMKSTHVIREKGKWGIGRCTVTRLEHCHALRFWGMEDNVEI